LSSTRIVIIEDHELTARGIEFVLHSRADLQIVGHFSGGPILERLEELAPDLILLDLYLPDQSGLALLPKIRTAHPNVRIIINTGQGAALEFQQAIAGGADGMVSKLDAAECVIEAIETVMAGRSYRSPQVRDWLGEHDGEPPSLTRRELEVLRLVAAGWSSRQVAVELGISDLTVKKHRENMARKLGAGNAVELARTATRLGLIHGDSPVD